MGFNLIDGSPRALARYAMNTRSGSLTTECRLTVSFQPGLVIDPGLASIPSISRKFLYAISGELGQSGTVAAAVHDGQSPHLSCLDSGQQRAATWS